MKVEEISALRVKMTLVIVLLGVSERISAMLQLMLHQLMLPPQLQSLAGMCLFIRMINIMSLSQPHNFP